MWILCEFGVDRVVVYFSFVQSHLTSKNLRIKFPVPFTMDLSITLRMDTSFDELKDTIGDSIPLWERIARKKRSIRDESIPQEWRLQPGQIQDTQLNVMDVPRQCAILTTRELEITETSASKLLEKIINRDYTSYEVSLDLSHSHTANH